MRSRLVLSAAVTLVTVGVATYVAVGATRSRTSEAPLSEIFAPITARYGIEVRWRLGAGFFPAEWAQYDAHAAPIDEAELRRMPRILSTALARYPDQLLADSLRRICLAADLSFYGQPFGGTNDDDSVYLCNEGVEAGFDDAYLAEAFHHELSSILMRRHGFSAAGWRALNPAGFEYDSSEDGGVKAIVNSADGLEGSPEYYVQGLLSEYAKAELEEDFNTYCEVMMTDPARLQRLAGEYPAIAAKHAACRAFYNKLGIEVP